MKAIFEVKTVAAEWKPPFSKKIETKEYEVGENESFEDLNLNGLSGKIFTVKAIRGNRVLIKYDRHFMIKGFGEDPLKKEKWIEEESPVEFSFMWANQGLTKKLILKKVLA
ncbi:MAG: hypothetical protein N3D73_01270 [Candidatus Diapherotrites archaeon]|nr:hypothetical protein [Candidatus Diapherotrites archaeon]